MNSLPVTAIIPAAGKSTRMGSAKSKALLNIDGQTVIQRSIKSIAASNLVTSFVILVPASQRSEFLDLDFGGAKVAILDGGAERQDSVRLGVEYLLAQPTVEAAKHYALIHDAARCMVSTQLVQRCIEAAWKHQAVSAGVPMVDSVKRVDSAGKVVESLLRSELWAVQTPQVFRLDLLARAHREAKAGATDDASLVEAIAPVYMVQGDRANIKVTEPGDIPLLSLGYNSTSNPS